MNTCKRCGYEWESRKANPKSCPFCKSYKWNEQDLKESGEFIHIIKQDSFMKNAKPLDTTVKTKTVSYICQDCGDPCEADSIRCSGCQKEFEYEQSLKGKE